MPPKSGLMPQPCPTVSPDQTKRRSRRSRGGVTKLPRTGSLRGLQVGQIEEAHLVEDALPRRQPGEVDLAEKSRSSSASTIGAAPHPPCSRSSPSAPACAPRDRPWPRPSRGRRPRRRPARHRAPARWPAPAVDDRRCAAPPTTSPPAADCSKARRDGTGCLPAGPTLAPIRSRCGLAHPQQQQPADHEHHQDRRHAGALGLEPAGRGAEQERADERRDLAGQRVDAEHLGALVGGRQAGHQRAAGRLGRPDEDADDQRRRPRTWSSPSASSATVPADEQADRSRSGSWAWSRSCRRGRRSRRRPGRR